ncbi:unnamed protein product [Camellia sinensis]
MEDAQVNAMQNNSKPCFHSPATFNTITAAHPLGITLATPTTLRLDHLIASYASPLVTTSNNSSPEQGRRPITVSSPIYAAVNSACSEIANNMRSIVVFLN